MTRIPLLILSVIVFLMSCGSRPSSKGGGVTAGSTADSLKPLPVQQIVRPTVVRKYPHDPAAYTQGLLWYDGKLYESTGEYGNSSLRRVDLETGRIEKKTDLSADTFGEGLALCGGNLYQLTWLEQTCYVYDAATFAPANPASFPYAGEGWGLTTGDGTGLAPAKSSATPSGQNTGAAHAPVPAGMLYMSDGSDLITIRDPETFALFGRIRVRDAQGAVRDLNELEWIDGRIWANIYTQPLIAVIDPATGTVGKYIDCSSLVATQGPQADVLNGIAHDPATGRIWLTGKNWDAVFEVTVP